MSSWLLSIPYLLMGIGFLVIARAAGGYAHALVCGSRQTVANPWFLNSMGIGVFLLVVRIASGLALISWLGAVPGVAGAFRLEVVLPLLAVVVIPGLWVSYRHAARHKPMLMRDRLDLGYMWLSSSRGERWFGAVVVLGFCALLLNAIVGAMVPDMNHDPMWYHLSVPQQWVFEEHFGVYPSVMPSAYPLAVESLFAIIFLLKTDPVLCSVLSALSGCMLFLAIGAASSVALGSDESAGKRGWGIAAVVGIWVPMLTGYGMVAPVQPKNDIISMLWAFCGAALIWLPLLRSKEIVSVGWWAVAGFLLGTACSAKPPILGVSFFVLLFAVSAHGWIDWRRYGRFPWRVVRASVVCVAMMLVAMLPWMVRGWQSHGLPLFPLGYSLFPTAPEFEPLFATFYGLHDVAEGSVGDWMHVVTQFPIRMMEAARSGEKNVFFYAILCMMGVGLGRGIWRWYGLFLAAMLSILVGMKGGGEVFRLFASAFSLAALMFAWLVARWIGEVSRPTRLVAGALIYVAAMGSVAWYQYRVAMYKTTAWRFHPVLAKEEVEQYATHAGMGRSFRDLAVLREMIVENERVLLLKETYPFYLHRNVIWNDEVIFDGGLDDRWAKMSPEEAVEFLRRENFDVVLFGSDSRVQRKYGRGPVDELVAQGLLEEIAVPDDLAEKGVALYQVHLEN